MATFPWMAAVQAVLEIGGIVFGFMISQMDGGQTGGYFRIGVHSAFIMTIVIGITMVYGSFSYNIVSNVRFVCAGLYVYCLLAEGIYFYFIVKISDPNVYDIVLSSWGLMTFFWGLYDLLRLSFFTAYVYDLYKSITGTYTPAKEVEAVQVMPVAVQEPEKKKVPLYLLDYEKMMSKK